MFCTRITLSQFLKNIKKVECFVPPPPSDVTGGWDTRFMFLKCCKNVLVLVHKTCLYIFEGVAYMFNSVVNASQAKLLKARDSEKAIDRVKANINAVYRKSLHVQLIHNN